MTRRTDERERLKVLVRERDQLRPMRTVESDERVRTIELVLSNAVPDLIDALDFCEREQDELRKALQMDSGLWRQTHIGHSVMTATIVLRPDDVLRLQNLAFQVLRDHPDSRAT